jgi:hypothetical protein
VIGFRTALAIALAVVTLPLTGTEYVAHASGGTASAQTVAVYRQICPSGTLGTAVGTVRLSLDDQGGSAVNPYGLEIRVAVTAGEPRTSYSVDVLDSSCQVLDHGGTLSTDDSGRGDLDFHVLGSIIPPATTVRVQLLASVDTLTSDPTSAP